MSAPGLKTVAFRTTLRQSLESTGWRGCVWARNVLAAECVQGWAGRKNPAAATMLRVYCTRLPSAQHTKEMALFFQAHGVPPFNLVSIQGYSREVAANRLSKGDTQDRFWLLRGYNALDTHHWDHWSLTHTHWGRDFQPSAQEALRIMEDPIRFDAMLSQDWSRQENFGEASHWAAIVTKYHAQWPNYSAMVQMLGSLPMSSSDDFFAAHRTMRTNYMDPKPMETFDLP